MKETAAGIYLGIDLDPELHGWFEFGWPGKVGSGLRGGIGHNQQ